MSFLFKSLWGYIMLGFLIVVAIIFAVVILKSKRRKEVEGGSENYSSRRKGSRRRFLLQVYNMLTLYDRILIGGLFSFSLLSFFLVRKIVYAGSDILIEVKGEEVKKLSLNQDGVFGVQGAIGEVEIEVKDRGVRVLSAPCPYKICIKMGRIQKAGETIVCAPSLMVIRIEGKRERGDIDAVTR